MSEFSILHFINSRRQTVAGLQHQLKLLQNLINNSKTPAGRKVLEAQHALRSKRLALALESLQALEAEATEQKLLNPELPFTKPPTIKK